MTGSMYTPMALLLEGQERLASVYILNTLMEAQVK